MNEYGEEYVQAVHVMRRIYATTAALIVLFILEAASRIQLLRMFDRPFVWNLTATYLRYGHIKAEKEGVCSMVFGGSTVCPDTLRFEYQGEEVVTYFCDPCEALPQPCFNVAAPALTIVDSWYLYQNFAGLESLENVFFLNGINDARSNNIEEKDFDDWYRHIQFYDEAYILFNHPEIRLTSIPTLFHLLLNRAENKEYLPKENLQKLNDEDKKRFLSYGGSIKTSATFKYLNDKMFALARQHEHRLIVGTFPYYHPKNYTLEAFIARKLSYAQSIFMTEMYGVPDNVVNAIEKHNAVIRSFKEESSEYENVKVLELDSMLPKDGLYFNDICHLSPLGCEVLQRVINENSGLDQQR